MKLYTVEIENETGTFFEAVTGSLQVVKQIANTWNNKPSGRYTATIVREWSTK